MPKKDIIWLPTGNRPSFQGLTTETPKNLELRKSKMVEDEKKLFGSYLTFWQFSDLLSFKTAVSSRVGGQL